MTSLFTARRQAADFESSLTTGLDLSSLSRRDAEALGPLLELVGELQAIAPPEPRADYVADLRHRLMAAADSALVPIDRDAEARLRLTSSEPGQRLRERRLAAVLAGAALIGATASVGVTALGALPGETLYPVKLAIENVRTDVNMDDGAKATMLLANASGRLDEVDQITRDGTPAGIAALPGALDTFSSQAGQAAELLLADYRSTGREGSITELRDFAGASMTMLARLEGTLPDGSRDELIRAARTIAVVDEQAYSLCPTCGGAGVTEVPVALASSGGSAGVTVPASLPGFELPRPTDGPVETSGNLNGRDSGGSTDTPGDTTDDAGDVTGTSPLPTPPTLPPTKAPGKDTFKDTGKDAGKDTAKATTDVIDTITGTLTGTDTAASDGGVVGGVVEGVEDVVPDAGEVVDGTVGQLPTVP